MPNGLWCNLNSIGFIMKLHDKWPNVKLNCQKNRFLPRHHQPQGAGFEKNTQKKIWRNSNCWNKFQKPALKKTTPVIGRAVGSETKSSQVAQATTSVLNNILAGKLLSLTDMHGIGLRLKFLWF